MEKDGNILAHLLNVEGLSLAEGCFLDGGLVIAEEDAIEGSPKET